MDFFSKPAVCKGEGLVWYPSGLHIAVFSQRKRKQQFRNNEEYIAFPADYVGSDNRS